MNSIESLTPEQEQMVKDMADEAVKYALHSDASYDLGAIREWLNLLYEGKTVDEIVVCDSPKQCWDEAKKRGYEAKDGEQLDHIGIGYDLGWTKYYEAMERLGVDFSTVPQFQTWKLGLYPGGVWATLLFTDPNIAIICLRPTSTKLNATNDLHCVDGKAIEWKDGFGYYFLNGVRMTEHYVMTPAEKLDVKEILNEKNVEQRRELVRKVGAERFVLKAGGKVLDRQGDYELLSVFLSDEVPDARYLKMKNPSVGLIHIEGVEGNTVQEALDFRAGAVLGKNEHWTPALLT